MAEWLLAEIAEDERIALEVPEQYRQWECTEFDDEMRSGEMRRVWMLDTGRGTAEDGFDGLNPSDLRHIARHDPARVLAECNAKRRIIELWLSMRDLASEQPDSQSLKGAVAAYESAVKTLASVFEGRPGYQEAWR